MATEVKIPVIGESVEEATLSTWSVSDGDIVEEGDILCEVESDKASLELPAEVSGKISLIASEGDDLKIGAVIATIDESAAGEAKPKTEEASQSTATQEPVKTEAPSDNSGAGIASPAARKMASEAKVNIENIYGSGKNGIILKEDVMSLMGSKPAPSERKIKFGPEERVKMTRLRLTIAKRLKEKRFYFISSFSKRFPQKENMVLWT